MAYNIELAGMEERKSLNITSTFVKNYKQENNGEKNYLKFILNIVHTHINIINSAQKNVK